LSLTATKSCFVTAGTVVLGSASARLIAVLEKLPSYRATKDVWALE